VVSGPPEGVDYARAYRLPRGPFGKGAVAAVCLLAAAGGLAWAARAGRADLFRPGELSAAHRREIAPAACDACHTPWAGPAAARCAECHPPNRVAHQAVQATSPGCGDCHFEHRGAERIQVVTDAACTGCHADLELAPGAVPRFASGIDSFASHPELAVAWRRGDGAVARLRLDSPEGRRADTATLKLDHAVHMKPGLLSPEVRSGRESLACEDCHGLAAEGGTAATPSGMVPISFELHCERCHRLVFDAALPPAPHLEPAALRDRLRGAYSGDRQRGRPVAEERRRAVRGAVGSRSPAELRALEARVLRAEYDLYRAACVVCHQVELDAVPYPEVAPPGLRQGWLEHAEFSHRTHLAYTDAACEDCHAAAAASTETADVLLPSIKTCLPCHGEFRAETAVARETEERSARGGSAVAGRRGGGGVPSRCIDCHDYHPEAGGDPGPSTFTEGVRAADSLPNRSARGES
jgi:hypothetical protein